MVEVDQTFLDEIRDKVDLLEYAESQGFEFKKSGRNYFTSCPLHIDNTPSLTITEDDDGMCRNFYCHSCKKGGGIIKWLTMIEKLRFMEAVDKAAKLAKMDLSKMCKSPTVGYLREQDRKYKKISKIRRIKHPILDESLYSKYSKESIPEWEDEGISSNIINEFDIRVDLSNNRIVYPVRNKDGDLINIKGRTRYDNYKLMRIPKYINYYKVEDLDYFQCLDKSKSFISESDEIIICESIKSVMKCYGWGIKNVVSAETHALSDGQIKLLLSLRCSNVILAFDKDVDLFSEKESELRSRINKLKFFINVYYIYDSENLLGEKDSPMDKGEDIWKYLYEKRKRW